MKKGGLIVQSGAPRDLYNNPVASYVAGFFGETNKFKSVVKNALVSTPIGNIKAPKKLESKNVEVHIRPQGVKLIQESTPVNGIKGTVMASRLMGEYSFVHLSVLNENNDIIHVHSHMPATFYPEQSSAVGIEIDPSQTFIFPE